MALPSSTSPGRRARIRFGAGAQATEELFLADVEAAIERLGDRILERPVRLVVPSRSLRAHVLARLVERRGRAVAGVSCTTLFGLAAGLVDQVDGPPNLHDGLALLFARRHAEDEDWLRRSLAPLREGFHAVDASVRDLIEAGLDPSHVEALEETLAAEGPDSEASNAEIQRARALVRTAGRALEELDELGARSTATLLQRAREIVTAQEAMPTEFLAIYGFSDAIGVATDLLTVLLDRFAGTIYLDQPPDPAAPEEPDAGNRFARRFTERISDVARPEGPVADRKPSRLQLFQAVGADAEAREVAARCRTLLHQGQRAERVGIVARRVEMHRTALRTHLTRLGVPFSADGAAGPPGPLGRRARALLHLLERRGAAPVERWLDARGTPFPRIQNFDLHLALATIGAGRLEEVPSRPYAAVSRGGSYALPVRRGFSTRDDEVFAHRRKVPLSALEATAASARRLGEHFDGWQRARTLAEHATRFRNLLHTHLEWTPASDLSREVLAIVDELTRGVSASLELAYEEFVDLVAPALERIGETPLGGRGGGVRILDVIEARGLTFEHLFVVGLNRGVFPRVVNEDPLLPDSLRNVLSRRGFGVLQDLPQKLTGYDEERYLFSQLLACAPAVTLSWQDVDDDNRQQTASPLVERLRWSPAEGQDDRREPYTARPLYSASSAEASATGALDRPAFEAATLAGIHGGRALFGRTLAVATDPTLAARGAPAVTRGLHAVRLRLLDEIDPERGTSAGERTRARLGPYFGFIGPIAPAGDPRSRDQIFVTTLESLSACSWRAFLERLLRLRPIPDPLEALPAVEPLYIGNLVHRVLERIVEAQLRGPVESLEQARDLGANVLWPAADEVAAILQDESERLVREEGFAFPGFARLLAEVVGPYLETARQVEWLDAVALPSAATELYGSLALPLADGSRREIAFKADRVDAGDHLALSDYKTGRPMSDKKTEDARRRRFLDNVRAGQNLQAVAYAMAAGRDDDAGRYVYLRPDADTEPSHRIAEVRARDGEFVEAFRHAATAALAAWDQGVFLPRLIEPGGDKEFRFCKSCRVAEACLRGDSAARARLRERVETLAAQQPLPPLEEALLEVWRLRDESLDDEPWRGPK